MRKKPQNRQLVPESAGWHNRQPALRVPEVPVEKRYRTRSLFQQDLF